MHSRTPSRRGIGPWFWLRPALAVTVSVALFAGIIVLRWTMGGAEDAISMLYVLPVALLALTFSRRVGIAAGVLAVALLVLWVVTSGESLSAWGWLSRVVPMLLLGGLVGDAADRIRDAAEAERRNVEVRLLQREAAEINDRVLQQMAAAKWMLEAGRTDDGVDILASTMDTAQELVGRMLGPDSVLAPDEHPSEPTSSRTRG